MQYLRSAIGSTIAIEKNTDDKKNMKYNNDYIYTKYWNKEAAEKLEYRYQMRQVGRTRC